MKKMSVWDILAWVALASIVVWAVLKIIGIINTPSLVEYYPVFAASYAFGWQIHKLSNVAEDVKELKRFKEATINEINKLKLNFIRNHGIGK